jgi:hypothetical protein
MIILFMLTEIEHDHVGFQMTRWPNFYFMWLIYVMNWQETGSNPVKAF